MEIDGPLFNPAKRRKFLRKRPDSLRGDAQPDVSSSREDTQTPTPMNDDNEQDTTISSALRSRKPHKNRKGGIEFSTTSKSGNHGTSDMVLSSENSGGRLNGISDRFVGHSGQSVDVDKHMMTYIAAEMAKRQNNTPEGEMTKATDIDSGETGNNKQPEIKVPQRQPATLGKLHEIDLGPDSKLQNIARTEAATRNLSKGDSLPPEDDPGKARLDKDGKPSRNRKRRNSEDVMRDRLVEEVLRESKLDVYEEPQRMRPDDDQAADDRIAEQFRRDFLDAIQSRRRGARAKNNKTNKTAKTEAPRGPKLGGSRSARAAMREKQAKEK